MKPVDPRVGIFAVDLVDTRFTWRAGVRSLGHQRPRDADLNLGGS